MRLCYLVLGGFNSISRNTCVSGSEFLRVLKGGLYTNSENLQLLISSLIEEFKIEKVYLHMMMKDSANKVIWKVYPEIKSGMVGC